MKTQVKTAFSCIAFLQKRRLSLVLVTSGIALVYNITPSTPYKPYLTKHVY